MDTETKPYKLEVSTAGHLYHLFEPEKLKNLIDKLVVSLRDFDKKKPFDAIAFTGISGAGLAFPLSYLTGKHIICVRKDGDDTHAYSWDKKDGVNNARNYVIVDDCIDTGKTIKRVRTRVEGDDLVYPRCKLLGIFLYWPCLEEKWAINNPGIEVTKINLY